MQKFFLFCFVFLFIGKISTWAQEDRKIDTTSKNNNSEQILEYERSALALVDSVLEAEENQKQRKQFELIYYKRFSTPYFYIPVDYLLDYNNYEGFTLGLGLMTNSNISKYFSIGGYLNYGFKDKAWKYGSDLILNLHQESESKIHFSYINDVTEKAGYHFFEKQNFTSSEIYRDFMIDNMDLIEKYQVSYSILMLKYLHAKLFLNQSYITSTDDYTFGLTQTTSTNQYAFCETGFQFRYAYKEKYKQNLEYTDPTVNNFPIILGNIIKGTNWFDGEYEYTKYEAKITQTFQTKILGKTKITVVGGLVDGNIPISKLYNGHGSYQSFSLESENSFGTMRMGEFYSDKFFSVFFKHEFNSIYKTSYSSPSIAIVQNYGTATLSKKQNHFDSIELKSYDKGYYESGLIINKIIKNSFSGLGFAIFYRYGPYALESFNDNISYKLNFTIGL